ncbi:MAG: hypothetical protein HYR51_07890 [Candidatus Rokubacteria bacterium]|nr:hypothetical protein [Candidatus Rokubacteria bacterium]
MSDTAPTREPVASARPDDDVGLLDYLVVLWRGRWLVIGFSFTVVVAMMVYMSFFAPFTYLATASLLPPKETGTSGLLGGLLGAAGDLATQLPGLSASSTSPNRDQFLGVLRSRRVAIAVIDKFKLRERYELPVTDDTIVALAKRTDVLVDREGVITVSATDTDPHVAAAMANFFVSELDRLVTQYNTSEAGRTRAFMTLQLAKAKAGLGESEDQIRAFQEKNRAIVLQDQTRGAIDVVARLKGEIMAAEVQLEVMRTWMTDASPDVVGQIKRIHEMKRYLTDLQFGDEAKPRAVNGTKNGTVSRDGDFHVPFAKVPEVGLELARLTREMKIQEAVVTLLTQQFEQARLSEARDLPTVKVLDVAIPPEKHYKPKFLIYTAITLAGSLFIGALLPFAVEHVKRLRRAWPSEAR